MPHYLDAAHKDAKSIAGSKSTGWRHQRPGGRESIGTALPRVEYWNGFGGAGTLCDGTGVDFDRNRLQGAFSRWAGSGSKASNDRHRWDSVDPSVTDCLCRVSSDTVEMD